ncbi:MAG: LytR/AlgR family response regulator transcription factor [Faecalibacterium sp.]
MLRIAVLEDQRETLEQLCGFIEKYAAEQDLQTEVTPLQEGISLIDDYQAGRYDILFLDVEMPGMNGFAVAERIREVDSDAVLVFVTKMAQYAIRGYAVDALDYVLKPVDYYQFSTKLSRAIRKVEQRRGGQVVLQLAGGEMQILDTREIYYLETRSRMLFYHTAKGEFSVRASLQSAEKKLAPYHFARCNQCYLVNLEHVQAVENDFVRVGGVRLEISRRQRAEFMTELASYLGGAL